MINRTELLAAIVAVEKECGARLIEARVLDVAYLLQSRLPDSIFPQALRGALNEARAFGEERGLLKQAMGKYFGSHGGKVAARNRQRKNIAKTRKNRVAATAKLSDKHTSYIGQGGRRVPVVIRRNGQYAFC